MKGKKKMSSEVQSVFEYVYVEHFNCGKNLTPLDYDNFKKMMETLVKEQQQSIKALEEANDTPVFNQWAAEIQAEDLTNIRETVKKILDNKKQGIEEINLNRMIGLSSRTSMTSIPMSTKSSISQSDQE